MGLSLEVYNQTSAVSTSLDDSKLLCDLPLTSRSQMPALNVIIGAIDMVNAMDVNGNDEQKQKKNQNGSTCDDTPDETGHWRWDEN